MRYRTWPILTVAFGILIVLIALSGLGALKRAHETYVEITRLHDSSRHSARVLNEIRSEIQLSAILVRDFLLDPSTASAGHYREQLLSIHSSMSNELDQLKGVIGKQDTARFERLRTELQGYWDSLDPLFEWTPQQKMAYSSFFLRKMVLPRRNAVLAIAQEIADLNRAGIEQQRQEIDSKQNELPLYLGKMAAVTLLLGLLVAVISIYRINRLEQRSEVQRKLTETAEKELRRLSQQLVQAQEEERRSISRELHDEVGQMLTALRVELRNLEEVRTAPDEEFKTHLEDSKQLSEQALRAVRDLAMGLRPAMLDDLGLGPALQWQAREFSRRFGVPVTVQIDGALDALRDAHRTCVYRVVQEALTNCARHAKARNIRIAVQGREDLISMTIQDDGAGFDTLHSRGRGLGLIGMEERVRELGGKMTVFSQRQKGTVLTAEIPLRKEAVPV